MTVAEIAPRLGFGVRRVREYAAAGKIPAVRLNRRDLRFHWPTVIRTLAGANTTKNQ
jgi:excisionase family DNA binding protein